MAANKVTQNSDAFHFVFWLEGKAYAFLSMLLVACCSELPIAIKGQFWYIVAIWFDGYSDAPFDPIGVRQMFIRFRIIYLTVTGVYISTVHFRAFLTSVALFYNNRNVQHYTQAKREQQIHV